MHIEELRIRNFRSIDDLRLPLDRFTTFCGPNSCGKSNVFRAIQLAFESDVGVKDAQRNLPTSKLVQGGPLLSIWVDCHFRDVPSAVQGIAGASSSNVHYSFRLTRGGTLTRKLGQNTLTADEFEQLRSAFLPVYVPPIRDLNGDGLEPFKRLIKTALQRARGPGNIRTVTERAKDLLERKAESLLEEQTALVQRLLGATRLSLDTTALDIEALYEHIGLRIQLADADHPLSAFGTGHQSAVIMHLYKQLGREMAGEVLYLFEEPDNHLHPSTIRSICDDLQGIAGAAQVLISTHSPIFIAHAHPKSLRPLTVRADGTTGVRKVKLYERFTEKQVRMHLESFSLKLAEPLLARRVIVVEGPTDKIVLAALFEKRKGRTIDQTDSIIIPAGSKDRAVLLCEILSCMSVEWRCLLDRDAAYSSEVPYTRDGLSTQDRAAAVQAADILLSILDSSKRRGRNASNSLNAMRTELTSQRPVPQVLEGSPLRTLISRTATLTQQEQAALRSALSNNRRRQSRELLEKASVFVWSTTMEGALLHSGAARDCVERELLRVGELAAGLAENQNREATLNNKLHGLGHRPEVLAGIVLALEQEGHFAYSDMNQCFRFLFE